ncbi:ABC transporter permease [Thermus thermamylovorans]|uniref:Multidrug ABC transporter permease n=1 Tax=Thermus thermamylovorans TaxID=2509362 RepID=A0A4Q9B9N9_9DEIN|nr:ABC-2 family transporter protein [Thermus thermamylovorans]TBH21723.1 multidrug ABC transporter permease [Thermus thermamylovorans]
MRKARTLLSVYLAYMLEYRAELFLWALAGALPLILLGVWTEAARGGDFPLSPGEFARYFLMVFLVRQATVVWVVWEFERDVVEGRLSFHLLRPLDPFFVHLAAHAAERLARLPFVVLLTLFFFWLFPEARFTPEPLPFLLGLLFTLLAFLLRFLMQYAVALLAFWSERASALEEVFFLLLLFLSGTIAPLEVFPEPLRHLALLTPFPYLVYLPAALLAGQEVALFPGVWVMLLWGVAFFLLGRLLWRMGLKHYSGQGA